MPQLDLTTWTPVLLWSFFSIFILFFVVCLSSFKKFFFKKKLLSIYVNNEVMYGIKN